MFENLPDTVLNIIESGWPITVVLTTLLVLITSMTVFMITSPSLYTPYNPDLLMEKTEEGDKPVDWRDEYGRFWTQAKGVRYIKPDTSVQIVVLGDIGRSPRMQNHAISVAKNMGRVDIIGYQGTDLRTVQRSLLRY
jgi:beta-1,4-mannosyltransferase